MQPQSTASLVILIAIGLALTSCQAPGASAAPAQQRAVAAHQEAQEAVRVVEMPAPLQQTQRVIATPAPDPAIALRDSLQPAFSGSAVSAAGAQWRLSINGLPKGTRQTAEGYWIGALPTAKHIEELHARGVRLLVSAAVLDAKAAKKRDRLRLGHYDIPFGSRFPRARPLLDAVAQVEPEQVFIHCVHGADRSGAILAFLLSVRHGWAPERALLAVAEPVGTNIRQLRRQLRIHDIDVEEAEIEPLVGIYSAQRNGHFGGLKATGPKYHRLIHTTLKAIDGIRAEMKAKHQQGAQPLGRTAASPAPESAHATAG